MWVCDLGNTRIRWAWHRDGALSEWGSALHRDEAFRDAWRPGKSEVVVVSVAGDPVERALEAWLRSQGVQEVRFPRSRQRAAGVTNAYTDVSQMGADRWAAMVAAHVRHTGPLAVIDCGSAITLDVLDPDGRHLGGAILPGLHMMSAGLSRDTARIEVRDAGEEYGLGADTAACVSAGVLSAAVGGIHRLLAEAERQLGAKPRRILCGGDAQRLSPYLEPVTPDPDLVLWGAVLLAEESIGRR